MFTNVTLLFVVLLFPLAGFIAWAGDRIGHRTGKRRHTLLGLRPRHTATLFTVGSGVLIVAVSFGVFWLSSESFRIVVREGEALYRNNIRLEAENGRKAEAIRKMRLQENAIRIEADRLNYERRLAEAARNDAQNRLAAAERDARQAQTRFREADARLRNARNEVTLAKGSLAEIQSRLLEKTRQVKRAERAVRNVESRRLAAEARVTAAELRVTAAEERQREALKEADSARRTAVRLVRDADRQRRNVETQLTEIRTQLQEQKALYATLRTETDAQQKEFDRLTRELEEKRIEYGRVAASTQALRGRQITYQVGEEVDRLAIRPGYNVWRIQAILYSFLTKAAKKAENRGASRGREERAVLIPPVPVVGTNTAPAGIRDTEMRMVSEEDALSAAAASIRKANEDVVVVALAQSNAVAGEPVAVRLEIYRNPIVLERDAKLAEIVVNGEGGRQEVADALFNFLNRDVHRRLVDAGMIPTVKGGDSGAEGTDMPRLEEFTLSGEEWLELMDEVRRSGSRARVIAYAGKTLRAGDPVSLRFEVKGRPSPPLQTAMDRWP
ncbi:MAG: DUF3084 domain-containing protein [Capsulimonadales bacterium]|nr:DUF3084 domain-containing protein [Capsulimonadales bacterium]